MSTTYGVLQDELQEALRDPDARTFTATDIGRMVNMAVAEVGRIQPEMFQEDIDLVADTLSYVLRTNEFGGSPVPEIEVSRVELWKTTDTPNTRYYTVPPASDGYAHDSQAGWSNWGGTLYIPNYVHSLVDGHETDFLLRVWGYSPYVEMTADDDVFNGGVEAKWAVVSYGRVEGLERLLYDRDLFTQWQTRSGNSDISPAGLRSNLMSAREDWRRYSRAITRLRARV